MSHYSLGHVSDQVLLRDLRALLAKDRQTLAAMLAHLGEVDRRKLYRQSAYASTYKWCVGELHFSESAAYRRIEAARAARRFPTLFSAVAEGRLHLSAVVVLSPYLTPQNCDALIAAATHKTKQQIEALLVERYPKPDLSEQVQDLGPAQSPTPAPAQTVAKLQMELAPERVGANTQACTDPVAGPDPRLVSGPVEVPAPRPVVKALSPRRFGIQFTVDESTHDKLRHAQALLGHMSQSSEIASIFDHALDLFIAELEKRKFAATARPRAQARQTKSARHVPAAVQRAVWARDGGQCTFVGDNGKRCEERSMLEFDHIEPVARGGDASAKNIRLRCRAHNQYEAERVFGVAFMRDKREQAQEKAPN